MIQMQPDVNNLAQILEAYTWYLYQHSYVMFDKIFMENGLKFLTEEFVTIYTKIEDDLPIDDSSIR